jgi:hypothetical protein
MTVELNARAYDQARNLIRTGRLVLDERDAWSEHQPSARDENEYIAVHGLGEYGHWFLGVDDDEDPDTKARYKFPYGDFDRLHRCGVIAAEARAAQRHNDDIEAAAAHLHGMLEALL